MLALPWIDYFPSNLLLAAVALNALIIYVLLAAFVARSCLIATAAQVN
jgi:hypothetical protein